MKNNITFADLMEIKQDLREKYMERLNLIFRAREHERDVRNGKFAQAPAREREKFNFLKDNLGFVNEQIGKLENTLNNSILI